MNNFRKATIQYGIYTTVALILFFFIVKMFGLVHNYNLRFLNIVVIGLGVYICLKNFLKNHYEEFDYLRGLGIGFTVSLITALSFASFVLVYLLLNQEFVTEIKRIELQGDYLNEFSVSLLIFTETLIIGSLITFASMQWLKQKTINSKSK